MSDTEQDRQTGAVDGRDNSAAEFLRGFGSAVDCRHAQRRYTGIAARRAGYRDQSSTQYGRRERRRGATAANAEQ
ncbi:hypothetical protein [Mycobacterium shottsii]|uniref:hypothetical protein n=1 Tax=Mycobacterium shottsii TaxID=133549 RepID=UPI0018E9D320|nr:hypothetical protein [Mycobacterium shottsii]